MIDITKDSDAVIAEKTKLLILESTDPSVTEESIVATDVEVTEKAKALFDVVTTDVAVDVSDDVIVEKAKELVVEITEAMVTEAAVVAPEETIVEKMKEIVHSLGASPVTEEKPAIAIDDETLIQKAKDLVLEITTDDVTDASVSAPDDVILVKITDIIDDIIVSDDVLMDKAKSIMDNLDLIVSDKVIIEKAKELIVASTDDTITDASVIAPDAVILEKAHEVIEGIIVNDAVLMEKAVAIVGKSILPEGIEVAAKPETVEEAVVQVEAAKMALDNAEKAAEKLAPPVIEERVPATIMPDNTIAIKEGVIENDMPTSMGVVAIDVAISSIPTADIGGKVVQVKPMHQNKAVAHTFYDGDSFFLDLYLDFNIKVELVPVILSRVDAPEMRGANKEKGKASRDWLKAKIEGKDIVVVSYVNSRNRKDQWSVEVFLDDVNINDLLVAEGHAVYK